MNDPPSAVPRPVDRGDLEQLMLQYQRADATATTALIRVVSPLLYRFFLRRSVGCDDAADLLQDTWLRIHKSRHTYRPGEPVLPWLYGIARHVQVDGFRRQQRIRSREQAMESLPEPVANARSDVNEMQSFDAIVARLPESQREVVTMLKVTGMSLEEVARATASSVGAVKQKAHRAYESLRQILRSRSGVDNREAS